MGGLITRTCLVAVLCAASVSAGALQVGTPPRLREASLPAGNPGAFGGGSVVLELTIDARGAVTRVDPLRATPPFTDDLASAAGGWRFDPAATEIDGRSAAVPGQVLVAAVFRPASFYAGPGPGSPPETRGLPSPGLPQPTSLAVPAYPPTAIGGGTVLVEIEMTARAEPRGYRVMSPASGFDSAALDAVKAWRFGPPKAPDAAHPLFVYAVLGFRAPLAPGSAVFR